MEAYPFIDVTFDGADEIDKKNNLIKGGGGCHLGEKLVASCSKRLVIVADWGKSSNILGMKWRKGVPVEVIPMGLTFVLSQLENMNGLCSIREGSGKSGPVVTDNGNFIVINYSFFCY